MRDLVLIGGGEHAVVLAETAKAAGTHHVIGFVDPNPYAEAIHAGLVRLGDDKVLPLLRHADVMLAFGSIGPADRRAAVAERLDAEGWHWATLVHPRAWVSPSALIGPGAVVLAGAMVQSGARVGAHAVVNTGAIVEHDVVLGTQAQVCPGVVIGGGTWIGPKSFLGLGARIRDHVTIGTRAVVAMGAVVTHDVADDETVAGVPARRMGPAVLTLEVSDEPARVLA